MSKICVFSDSHGYADNMLRAIAAEMPDRIIHLGDGCGDLAAVSLRYPDLPIDSVRGNCDRFSAAPTVLDTEYFGKRIFAVHGHTFDVKHDASLVKLKTEATERDADIILFGHTHVPYRDRSWAMEILNPGSCGEDGVPTYGVIQIDGGRIETMICRVQRWNEGT